MLSCTLGERYKLEKPSERSTRLVWVAPTSDSTTTFTLTDESPNPSIVIVRVLPGVTDKQFVIANDSSHYVYLLRVTSSDADSETLQSGASQNTNLTQGTVYTYYIEI